MSHRGHIYISPNHKVLPSSLFSDTLKLFIDNLLDNNVSENGIMNLCRSKYNQDVTIQQIRRISSDKLEKKISSYLEDDVSTSTASDRLIATLKATPGISFVYVLHDLNSGYVKYQQKRKQSTSSFVTEDSVGVTFEAMATWRHRLKVGNKDQILVSIAWALEQEIEEFKNFPEYVACDVTFGVNKNQRNLALLAVVDGNNNVSTICRCLMPSKERRAYLWLFEVALPYLFPLSSLKKFQSLLWTTRFPCTTLF